MVASEVAAEVERGDILFDLGLASTTYTLLRRLEENPVIKRVKRQLSEHPEIAPALLDKAVALFESPAPKGHSHPEDLKLCAYLFILASSPSPDAQSLIDRVAKQAGPAFFASRAAARYLQSHVPATTLSRPMVSTRPIGRLVRLRGPILSSSGLDPGESTRTSSGRRPPVFA
jgi:hypothetical protein